jgi:hypothetical protein
MSAIFNPILSRGSVTRAVITACGDEPVPTLCLPVNPLRISGLTPSFLDINAANPPATSSRAGMSFFT